MTMTEIRNMWTELSELAEEFNLVESELDGEEEEDAYASSFFILLHPYFLQGSVFL